MKSQFQRIVVVGASRGIGAAVAEHIVVRTDELITVSRSPSRFGNWIEADLSTKAGIETVYRAVKNLAIIITLVTLTGLKQF